MFFDTKSVELKSQAGKQVGKLIAALVLLAAPLAAHAQSKFPFTIERDSSGAVSRIEIPVRQSIMSDEQDVLAELRVSLKDYQDSNTVGMTAAGTDAIAPQNADDKKTYEQAKAFLKNDLSVNNLADARLDKEFSKAKSQILNVKMYRLLAAPTKAGAFDREQALAEVVKNVLGEAGSILNLTSPAYSIFEFLVEQYIESLESRREFYQNQLLVLLANDSTLFTDKEKSAIRSSIFYSRLSFIKLSDRSNARKNWSSFGDTTLAAALKPCKDFVKTGENGFGQCFKQSGDLYVNRLVKKNKLSKSVSVAFDSKNPQSVRDLRALLILAKLGVKLLPVPSLAKKPVNVWLDSQYKSQRKSEGYFFGYATLKNQADLADWILTDSANPLIRR